jgi:hypothetical protein
MEALRPWTLPGCSLKSRIRRSRRHAN